jgi:hypothetical protein
MTAGKFLSLVRKNFEKGNAKKYTSCTPYVVAPRSTIYAHDRDGRQHFTATGQQAIDFCTEHLGPTTKKNGHGHLTWYLYEGLGF